MHTPPRSVRVGRLHSLSARRQAQPFPSCTRDNRIARAYAQQLVEFLHGKRALHQIARLTTDDIRADLNQLIRRRWLQQPALGNVFDYTPCPRVLEVSAMVHEGERVHPLAFRLELRKPRRSLPESWIFTALRTPF
ncbi:Rv3235 family protein [Streptacidiphilus monticola]|uniref:Rv3235 family protein n=1 Tax=Streptacidiphilus monticola TaxID=2161674 RepID=A0ABW1G0W3_9ACTN